MILEGGDIFCEDSPKNQMVRPLFFCFSDIIFKVLYYTKFGFNKLTNLKVTGGGPDSPLLRCSPKFFGQCGIGLTERKCKRGEKAEVGVRQRKLRNSYVHTSILTQEYLNTHSRPAMESDRHQNPKDPQSSMTELIVCYSNQWCSVVVEC